MKRAKSTSAPERARIKAGISLEDAARKIEVQPRSLRNMERGNSPFCFYNAEVLSSLYNCRMEVFMHVRDSFLPSGETDKPASPPKETAPAPKSRRYRGPKEPILVFMD